LVAARSPDRAAGLTQVSHARGDLRSGRWHGLQTVPQLGGTSVNQTEWRHWPARQGQRWRHTARVPAFYVPLSLVVLSPLTCKFMPYTGANDLANHVSGIIEARNALAEGQFPIRVAPHQLNGQRYPIFQFYGNLSYTAGGLLYAAGMDPYRAWKTV